eukprot:28141-Prymnesium_polylepis.1
MASRARTAPHPHAAGESRQAVRSAATVARDAGVRCGRATRAGDAMSCVCAVASARGGGARPHAPGCTSRGRHRFA